MSDFLAGMASASHARVARARLVESEPALRRRALATPPPSAVRLSEAGFDLIAEIKFHSPSVGPLSDGRSARDVASRARNYASAGAAAISVLTETDAFGGSLDDLAGSSAAVSVPVMRKDFLVDPYQIWEARASGAGGVLLIVRMLDDERLNEMLDAAAEAALFVLLEVFDEADLVRAVTRATTHPAQGRAARELWIGVNSRDLATLSVVPERLERMAGLIPPGIPAVAESGIATPEDAAAAAARGYSLALVGTALMRAPDPGALLGAMVRAGRAARGLGTAGASPPGGEDSVSSRAPDPSRQGRT